jgi:hypothetical protein
MIYAAWTVISLTAGGAPEMGSDALSLFDDPELARGFSLSALRSSALPIEVGTVLAADTDAPPRWRLAQWGSRFSLDSAKMRVLDDGTRALENEGKRAVILPGGLAGQGVELAVNGIAEYGGRLREKGEPWPHLLVEQKMEPRLLHEMDTLRFSVEFRVEHCAPAAGLPLNPGLHTAHVTAFWTIHNVNPDSPDHNDMIWFGLPLFDARYPVTPGHQAVDAGQEDATRKFICTIEGKRFYDKPVQIGAWSNLACDMLPLLREALEASQAKGFLTNTRFEDLAATSFNLGWEVPGPYDCAITVRKLSLQVD